MFVFWMIWPYVMARVSQVIFLKFTGKVMPKETARSIQKDLRHIKERIKT